MAPPILRPEEPSIAVRTGRIASDGNESFTSMRSSVSSCLVFDPESPLRMAWAASLRVSTDELLGVRRLKEKAGRDPVDQRLWRKFQQIKVLPEKDQRAILRMVNSLVNARGNGNGRG